MRRGHARRPPSRMSRKPQPNNERKFDDCGITFRAVAHLLQTLGRCERFLLPDVDHESIWNRQTTVNCLFDKTANCALSG